MQVRHQTLFFLLFLIAENPLPFIYSRRALLLSVPSFNIRHAVVALLERLFWHYFSPLSLNTNIYVIKQLLSIYQVIDQLYVVDVLIFFCNLTKQRYLQLGH